MFAWQCSCYIASKSALQQPSKESWRRRPGDSRFCFWREPMDVFGVIGRCRGIWAAFLLTTHVTAGATLIDPAQLTSQGPNPFAVPGTYVIDTSIPSFTSAPPGGGGAHALFTTSDN